MNTVLPITMICQLSTCIIDEVFWSSLGNEPIFFTWM
jgi:hypothetical protein